MRVIAVLIVVGKLQVRSYGKEPGASSSFKVNQFGFEFDG